MSANHIEIILSRQLADCLSIPVFLTDEQGDMLFFNEPAGELLGKRFEETGEMSVEEWSNFFKPVDKNGIPISRQNLPLVKTLTHHYPAHGEFWIESLKGKKNKVSVTTYPVIGRPDRFLGVVVLFWKTKEL